MEDPLTIPHLTTNMVTMVPPVITSRQMITQLKNKIKNLRKVQVSESGFDGLVKSTCLNDTELFNVAVNYSIVKHNEFKSMNESKVVSTENLEHYPMIEDHSMSQDFHLMQTEHLEEMRKERAVFIEKDNRYYTEM